MEIQVKNIYKVCDEYSISPFILKDVSFHVSPGEAVFIEGENQVGKTTLLNLLAGIEIPTSGEILINGKDLFSLSAKERAQFRKKYIGYVLRENHLIDGLTIYKNLEVQLIIHKYPRYMRRKTIVDISEKMGITDLFEYGISHISEKQKVLVSVARALICSPELLLVDDPDRHISSYDTAEIHKLLIELSQEYNFSLIVTTSKSEESSSATRYFLTEDSLANAK